MNSQERNDLDNYITGHYGEDQFKGEDVGASTIDARRLSDELRQIIFGICGQTVMQTDAPITLNQAATIQHRIERRLCDLCADLGGHITYSSEHVQQMDVSGHDTSINQKRLNIMAALAQEVAEVLSEHDTEKGFIKEVNDALDKF